MQRKTADQRNASRAGQRLPFGAVFAVLFAANIVILFVLLPLPWLQKAFLIASPFCPQRPAHSVFIGGQQMPIEARMFGMFGGALLAILYFAARGQLRAAAMPRGWRLGLGIAFFSVMALDGTHALLYDIGLLRLYTPNLYLRLGTGLASGIGIAMILIPLNNLALWHQSQQEKPLFTGARDVVGMLATQALLFVLTLTDWEPMLLPLAAFNSIAILVIMTVIFTLMLVIITQRSGRFTTWRSTAGYFGIGFVITAAFIAALAVARLSVFGPGSVG